MQNQISKKSQSVSRSGDRWNLSPQFYKNIRKLGKQLDEAGFIYQKKDEDWDIIEA